MTLPNLLRSAPAPGASPRRDRRSYKRVDLRLTGRFLTSDSDDRELLTSNVSCDGAFILSSTPPNSGQQIVCYFDELGRVVAEVIRMTPGGFAVRFQTSHLKRDKLADRLTWLVNKDILGLDEERAAPRFSATGQACVILSDGTQLQCRLTDISLTGAAFEALGTPPYVGDRVHTGNLPAEVVRVAGKSFAVRYLRGAEAAAS
ncbi:PilZ domain-containing protein [Hyphomonas sp.]|uniref:PilZ domain-containing protein n=1 Tax=Hyphomonas sp. TaxID=87 RepID=UPI000A407698|nr:PilZ domain-containing protein [Hyphomonas sp.]